MRTNCCTLLLACCLCWTPSHVASFRSATSSSFCHVTRITTAAPGIRSDAFLGPATGRRFSSSSSLSHMGHSHSHHDHSSSHGHTHHSHSHGGSLIKLGRRQVALLGFAAIAICIPQVVWRRKPLTSAHVAVFTMTTLALSLADATRRSVLQNIRKLQRLRARVVAHAPKQQQVVVVQHDTNNKASASSFLSFFNNNAVIHYLFRNDNAADRVTLLGVAMNTLLSIGKLAVGVTCHSSALVADAGHSLSDLCSDFVTLGSVQLARLPPDEDHPYGHGKFEAVGSLFLALTLLGAGISIGTMASAELMAVLKRSAVGVASIASAATTAGHGLLHLHSHGLPQSPTPPALLAALISIVSKEWLYRITRKVGEDLNSQVVIANAWHHRSDAYSSVLALLSIGLAMFVPGMVFADSAAGLLVAGMICATGVDILGESINQLTDTAVDREYETRVHALASHHGDVLDVTQIRARQVGSKAFMDVSVEIPPDFSNTAIRAVEEQVRQRIISEPYITDAVVRASSKAADVIVCPLLEAATGGHSLPTVSEVENSIRQVLLLKHHSVIVKNVTVHYGEGNSVIVDVNIQIRDSHTMPSVSTVQQVADQVRTTIIDCQDYIRQANIFLDLNEPSKVRQSLLVA